MGPNLNFLPDLIQAKLMIISMPYFSLLIKWRLEHRSSHIHSLKMFYFEIIIDLCATVRNNSEGSQIPFTPSSNIMHNYSTILQTGD